MNLLPRALPFLALSAAVALPRGAPAAPLADYKDVVVAPKATAEARAAARDLQHHLEKIAGRPFPIVDSPPAGSGPHFFVGAGARPELDAALAALPPEGWLLRSAKEGLLLAGADSRPGARDERGTSHAVSLFLEKHAGVRWLWPGASGEVIPSNPRLEVPPLDEQGAPLLKRRRLDQYYGRYRDPRTNEDIALWGRRARLGDQVSGGFGHAWSHVIPAGTYFKDHPEWFSLVAGQRVPTQLCSSNPQLREQFAKSVLALPGNQKLDYVSISPNDGYGFCECDACKAKGGVGDAYWDFANDVALRVKALKPGQGVGSFAYTYGRQPPSRIARLPDNVCLAMTTYSTQCLLPEGLEEYRAFVEAWKSKGVKILMREYWGCHYWLDLPILYPDEIAATLKQAVGAGLIGAYGEVGKNWATQAPNYWMLTHVLWDPSADPAKVMGEFYRAFGKAEKPVRAYFDLLGGSVRRVWREKQLQAGYSQLVTAYGAMFPPELMARAAAHLDEAEKAAGGDADLKARVAFLRVGCEYTALMGELLGLYDKLGRTGFPLEAFEWEATVAPRRAVLRNPAMAEGRDWWEKRLAEPFPYTLADKDAWLLRAWELGQKRIQLYNANRANCAVDEGLYAITLEHGMREWHPTLHRFLGKPEGAIAVLDYTRTKKAAPAPPNSSTPPP
jgi:hypothetical protein